MDILADIWDASRNQEIIKCPQCGKNLILIQMEPFLNFKNDYITYNTVIECNNCSFNIMAESFTILGSVIKFDSHNIQIGSWIPSGSRVLSDYQHILDYRLLKNIKESGKLVEFLIVDNQVVQIIG
jgi:hypothetical protein